MPLPLPRRTRPECGPRFKQRSKYACSAAGAMRILEQTCQGFAQESRRALLCTSETHVVAVAIRIFDFLLSRKRRPAVFRRPAWPLTACRSPVPLRDCLEEQV